MKKDYTDITIILDRSGSMASVKEASESGLQEFIQEQKKVKGDLTRVSLVQFDTKCEIVYANRKLNDIDKFNLKPGGMTALNDAIGKTIIETGDRIRDLPEEERPENVVVVIMTDGLENASQEYNSENIKKMIKEQETKYSWTFVFLGANQDAVLEAKKYGIKMETSLTYSHTGFGHEAAFRNTSKLVNRGKLDGMNSMCYTDKERVESISD